MTTREEWKSMIGEGIHTGFRKGTEHAAAPAAWTFIAELDPVMWDEVLDFCVEGLAFMGMIEESLDDEEDS